MDADSVKSTVRSAIEVQLYSVADFYKPDSYWTHCERSAGLLGLRPVVRDRAPANTAQTRAGAR